MRTRSFAAALCAAVLSQVLSQVVLAQPVRAQSPFATQVVSFQQGTGGGIFVTQNILGGPLGGGLTAGSLDVLTLGEGGNVVLGFDVALRDGPGADLAVFENGFQFGAGNVFAEIAFVEVSSNGTDFARFPSDYGPPAGGGTPIGTYEGLAGGTPVVANVSTSPDSPFNPVTSGGEAFDFADLASDPLVVGGQVDLQGIHFVRLVDVVNGNTDSHGTVIGGAAGAPDFDAVAALHHDLQPVGGPVCDLSLDAQGFLVLRLGDPDGFKDLSLPTLASSVSLVPLPFTVLLDVMTVVGFDGQVAELRSLAPVTGLGLTLTLCASVKDKTGAIGGDEVTLND